MQGVAAKNDASNQNFRSFAAENVFILKQEAGPDHWLDQLPGPNTSIVTRA